MTAQEYKRLLEESGDPVLIKYAQEKDWTQVEHVDIGHRSTFIVLKPQKKKRRKEVSYER